MSDEKKPFTVNDRRLFTPEGEARGDVPDEPKPAAANERKVEPPIPGPEATPAEDGSLDFIGLLVSLGAQASALMGGVPEEEGGAATVDLPSARSIIGLIETLERKTEGRRTPEEDQVLAGLLYELRMAYVARSR